VWFALILAAYLCAAALYALRVPAWQSPDEPAHFNYIAHIAEGKGLPVLQMGDYDQVYRDRIVGARFDPALSIEPLRYEFYQPPLYYLSATPIYWVSSGLGQQGTLTALRFYNVFLGTISLLLLYRSVVLVFPHRVLISLGALGFAGLIPMHVAMTASVNNDGLAELLLVASTLILLSWLKQRLDPNRTLRRRGRMRLVWLGILLGLGLLTKIYAYLLLPLFVVVVGWVAWRHPAVPAQPRQARVSTAWRGRLRQTVICMCYTLLPALLLGVPLWLRNMGLYGLTDPLALNWHDRVVIGQPTTAGWIEQYGWLEYWERAFTFTFRSFWGVFGWMGVFWDERIYTALLFFSGLLFMGVLWATVRLITNSSTASPELGPLNQFQRSALWLFALMWLVVVAAYVAYNMKFVQHQGRYLFWGIVPIATFMAVGWRELLQPPQSLVTGILATFLTLAFTAINLVDVEISPWTLLTAGAMAAFLLVQPLLFFDIYARRIERLPQPIQDICAALRAARVGFIARTCSWALPFVSLFILNIASVYQYILPQLSL
jgi:hypothetical protein